MYTPTHFAVTDPAELETLLSGLAFGCLVSHGAQGLDATHLPFLYDADARTLAGHMARPNPHWEAADGAQALAIFQSVNAYVSPNLYPSKRKHGRVVPTWNYEAVHIHGTLHVRDGADWKRAHLTAMTDRFEAMSAKPWALDDAPADYLEALFNGLVGFELAIDRVQAKRKLSQNRAEPDRLGVIAGLSASDEATDRAVAAAMSALKPA